MKLYHYVHCPFCLRVRMALGYLEIPYESIVVAYDNEDLPIKKCGKKMLPIFEWTEGDASNESLDIIKRLDENDDLSIQDHFLNDEALQSVVNELLDQVAGPVHNLVMPYWIWTPEFNEKSRQYFLEKKSVKRGPFHLLAQKKEQFLEQLDGPLKAIDAQLSPFYLGEKLSVIDIMLASHLWGLYMLPEFQFQTSLHSYLQTIKRLTKFDYHGDFWKTPPL